MLYSKEILILCLEAIRLGNILNKSEHGEQFQTLIDAYEITFEKLKDEAALAHEKYYKGKEIEFEKKAERICISNFDPETFKPINMDLMLER